MMGLEDSQFLLGLGLFSGAKLLNFQGVAGIDLRCQNLKKSQEYLESICGSINPFFQTLWFNPLVPPIFFGGGGGGGEVCKKKQPTLSLQGDFGWFLLGNCDFSTSFRKPTREKWSSTSGVGAEFFCWRTKTCCETLGIGKIRGQLSRDVYMC